MNKKTKSTIKDGWDFANIDALEKLVMALNNKNERILFFALMDMATRDKLIISLNPTEIAKDIKVNHQTISKTLDKFQELDYIKKVKEVEDILVYKLNPYVYIPSTMESKDITAVQIEWDTIY